MRRRDFIAALGGTATLAPFIARSQQQTPVIGFLGADVEDMRMTRFGAFHQGLAEAGYINGRNITIEYRWAEGRVERYPELVAEFVRRQVAVIVSLAGIPGARAAKAATTTIPIVFSGGLNPVEAGIVESLARPGGNLTGVTTLALSLGPKRLEVMQELLPTAKLFALLINPDHPNAGPQTREFHAAARVLGLQTRIVHARAVQDFDAAFTSLAQLGAAGVVIGAGQPLSSRPREMSESSARHRVPAIHEAREFVAAGGLVSYSGSRDEAYRLVGGYVGRILKGEKPADLPVQQSTKVELFVNLKTARTLGINVPLSLLGRADEVIE